MSAVLAQPHSSLSLPPTGNSQVLYVLVDMPLTGAVFGEGVVGEG